MAVMVGWQDARALQAPGRQWGTASTAMGRSKPIRSGPGQLPGRAQDAARTPYLGRGCAQDGIGGAAEARTGGDGVHPSRGTEIRALTKPDALLAGINEKTDAVEAPMENILPWNHLSPKASMVNLAD